MTLYETLQRATSEEDVKAAYIKALGLKNVQRNLIDIQTKEIWFEAKLGGKVSIYRMFTQLLNYVWVALNKDSEEVPPFLCVVDSEKAALMKTSVALPLLKDKAVKIKWGKSASDVTSEALDAVSQFIGTHFVSFRIETQEREFIDTVKAAIRSGEIIRTQITPDNLKQVFDRWVEMIGREISGVGEDDYCLLFFADVMSDGTVSTHENLSAELIHRNGRPAFLLGGKPYDLGSMDGYNRFWAIYNRPPPAEYRNYILERRDSLIPYDERAFKGAFYTPLHIVDKAYDLLNSVLGANWQRDYIVWDMCCGVGNLETKHANPRNVFMSTLDQPDVDVMVAAKTCRAATRFQYDYLNDDIAEDGTIDYSLSGKMPPNLRAAIAAAKEGKKKFLVLINPPYAEATNADNTAKGSKMENKTGVAKTKWAQSGMSRYGRCSNELFAQFFTRIAAELPNAVLASFSTLKYVNSQTFETFRKEWPAKYLGGFVVHSKAFDGLKGDFPIGFLVWKTGNTCRTGFQPVQNATARQFPEAIKTADRHFFSRFADTSVHNRNLPHWGQDGVIAFVTFRLADSIPAAKLRKWQEEKDLWLKEHPEPWDEDIRKEYADTFPRRMDEWLDAGSGDCLLAQSACCRIVENALEHFNGTRYVLHSYIVMPNHVHVMFEMERREDLPKVVHSWKSFTANEINKVCGRTGTVWQSEYFDRLIRNEEHYSRTLEYIKKNERQVIGTGRTGFQSVQDKANGQDGRSPSNSPNFPASISCEVLDKGGMAIGEKTFYNIPNDQLLTNWIVRPKPNGVPCVPLTNAIEPPKAARRDQRGTKWSDGAIGYMCTGTNDIAHTNYVFILSSGASMGHGMYITQENLGKAVCLFAVEHLVTDTWQNHNDQFLIPSGELTEEFKLDCLVYMLFHGKNLTASANDLEWNGKKWSIVNHFIPFTEDEVDAPGRFESDFMVQQLAGKGLSAEAQGVMDAGREVWRTYFRRFGSFDYSIREKFKLNRPDVGWYQIRQALKAYGESSEGHPTDFSAFEAAYAALSAKLRPQVYSLGFLKA